MLEPWRPAVRPADSPASRPIAARRRGGWLVARGRRHARDAVKNLNPDSVRGTALEPTFRDIAERLEQATGGALPAAEVQLTVAPEHTGADLALACFPLARSLRKNPAQIAGELADAIAASPAVARAEAAGPYLNLSLERGALCERVVAAARERGSSYGDSERESGQRVMVEYVSPNTNKPLHLGHVRNAVLGRAVARLVASQGAEVLKTDIINDRGIHIAKSMIAYRDFAAGETPQSSGEKGDHFVGRWYVRFDQELRAERRRWDEQKGLDAAALEKLVTRKREQLDEEFQQQSELMQSARALLQQWEAEDPEVRELWRTMNQWVYDGFAQTYELLGIDFDKHYYESDIYRGGREIILDALERGVFEKAPNGAVIAPLSKHGNLQDKVVLRGDGTGLYITQDINLATIKFEEFQLTRSLYVIGSEQDFYMKQLKATLELLGVPWASEVHHLSYGMVYLPEGKMKSREGTVVDADDLVHELRAMAREELEQRLGDGGERPPDEELERRALAIALSAITFNFLLVGRETDIQFDPRSSLAFEGKTGPYLQYTGARIASILRKADEAGGWSAPSPLVLESDAEWRLVQAVALYPLAVADAAQSYDPARLATALFELAQSFNALYHDHRVLDAEEPQRSSRLALLEAVLAVLRGGMGLLGIEALEEM